MASAHFPLSRLACPTSPAACQAPPVLLSHIDASPHPQNKSINIVIITLSFWSNDVRTKQVLLKLLVSETNKKQFPQSPSDCKTCFWLLSYCQATQLLDLAFFNQHWQNNDPIHVTRTMHEGACFTIGFGTTFKDHRNVLLRRIKADFFNRVWDINNFRP